MTAGMAGKRSSLRELLDDLPNIVVSLSCTFILLSFAHDRWQENGLFVVLSLLLVGMTRRINRLSR